MARGGAELPPPPRTALLRVDDVALPLAPPLPLLLPLRLPLLLRFLALALSLPLPLAGCEPIMKMSLLSSDSLLLSLPEPLPSLSLLSCMEIACPRGLAAVAALR